MWYIWGMKTDLHVLAAWLDTKGLETDIREHYLAANLRSIKAAIPDYPSSMFAPSPWHLIVTSPIGKISIIRGGNTMGDYEIDWLECLECDRLDGPLRYQTFKDVSNAVIDFLSN